MNPKETYHIPVLVNEVLEYIQPKPNGIYLDVTFGGGSHTRAILAAEPTCKVYALDWDRTAIEMNAEPLAAEFPDRFFYFFGNFAHLQRLSKKFDFPQFDGVLADFGTSQHQIFNKEGMSFATDTPLDMRMSAEHFTKTAADFINFATEEELLHIFFTFGQEPRSRVAVRAIIEQRKKKRFKTTKQLIDCIVPALNYPRSHTHPATRIFQALRIVVNQELEAIESFLKVAPDHLKIDGNLVCISFHSLEDRIVKQALAADDRLEIMTKKVITASEEELKVNPSSRSAKLRAAKRVIQSIKTTKKSR
jgi:16S rRNA (cytosine1402-N4)-methyltransferase